MLNAEAEEPSSNLGSCLSSACNVTQIDSTAVTYRANKSGMSTPGVWLKHQCTTHCTFSTKCKLLCLAALGRCAFSSSYKGITYSNFSVKPRDHKAWLQAADCGVTKAEAYTSRLPTWHCSATKIASSLK